MIGKTQSSDMTGLGNRDWLPSVLGVLAGYLTFAVLVVVVGGTEKPTWDSWLNAGAIVGIWGLGYWQGHREKALADRELKQKMRGQLVAFLVQLQSTMRQLQHILENDSRFVRSPMVRWTAVDRLRDYYGGLSRALIVEIESTNKLHESHVGMIPTYSEAIHLHNKDKDLNDLLFANFPDILKHGE